MHVENDSRWEKPNGRCCTKAEYEAQDFPRHRARYADRGMVRGGRDYRRGTSNRPTCSMRSAPNVEPAPPSCCRPATPKLCSFTSMRSQPKSLRALTLLSSSIKPGGMAPRPSRFQTTSRSCSFRHAHLNSTAKKISGNSCGRTGCRTEFSNPSTISSTTAATLGTHSSISLGRSCPSRDATGQQSVTQTEDWYKPLKLCNRACCSVFCRTSDTSPKSSRGPSSPRRRHAAHRPRRPRLHAGAIEGSKAARPMATGSRVAIGAGRCCRDSTQAIGSSGVHRRRLRRPLLNCRVSGFVQSLESQPLSGLVLVELSQQPLRLGLR